LNDSRKEDDLRIAILELMTTVLDSQPGLASIFFLKHSVDESDEPESIDGEPETQASLLADSEDSIIISMLNNCTGYLKTHPHVLSSTLGLLTTLWKSVPAHNAFISVLRNRKNFWPQLTQLLAVDPYIPDKSEVSEALGFEAHRVLAQARAFEIVLMDLFYLSASNQIESNLEKELNTFFTTQGKEIGKWVTKITKMSFEKAHHQKTHQTATSLSINLNDVLSLPFQQTYGTDYYYNTSLLKKKLGQDWEKNPSFNQFVADVEKLNQQLSVMDAQTHLIRTWCKLLEVMILRFPKHLGYVGNSGLLTGIIKALATAFHENEKQDKYLFPEIGSLLLLVIDRWSKQVEKKTLMWPYSSTDTPSTHQFVVMMIEKLRNPLRAVVGAIETTGHENVSVVLGCLHILLKFAPRQLVSPSVSGDQLFGLEQTKWFGAIQHEVFILVPDLLSIIRANEALKPLCIAMMDLVHTYSDTLLVSMTLDRTGSPLLPELLARLKFEIQKKSDPTTVSSILHFILCVASSPRLAVSLFSHHFIASLAAFPITIDRPYTSKNEINPWQSIWCMVMNILCEMLSSLRTSDCFRDFRTQVLEFLSTYSTRINQSLQVLSWRAVHQDVVVDKPTMDTEDKMDLSDEPSKPEPAPLAFGYFGTFRIPSAKPDPSKQNLESNLITVPSTTEITVGSIKEAMVTIALLYQLHTSKSDWYFLKKDIGHNHFNVITRFLVDVINLLRSPPTLVGALKAITKKEKILLKEEEPALTRSQLVKSKDQTVPPTKDGKKTDEVTVQTLESKFYFDVEVKLFRAIGHTLSFLQLYFVNPFIKHESYSPDEPLFDSSVELQPYIDAITKNPEAKLRPPIGFISECLNLSSTRIKKLQNLPAKDLQPHLAILQQSLFIIAAHAKFFSIQPHLEKSTNELISGVQSCIDLLNRGGASSVLAILSKQQQEHVMLVGGGGTKERGEREQKVPFAFITTMTDFIVQLKQSLQKNGYGK